MKRDTMSPTGTSNDAVREQLERERVAPPPKPDPLHTHPTPGPKQR